MRKTLVSWIATNHDFLDKNELGEMVKTDTLFNEDGPHFSLHRDFSGYYDTHYLLCQYSEDENTDPRWEMLARTLSNRFKTKVIVRYMDVSDILSVGTIKGKVQELINKILKDMEVEIFVSPGSPTMQIAWYLLGAEISQKRDILFFRRREQRFVKDGTVPKKEPIRFDTSEYSRVTNILDNFEGGIVPNENNHFITPSYKKIYDKALQLAGNYSTPVLIQGEIGTGKSHLARFIHDSSNRRSRGLVTINCAAHRSEVLENLLFGFEPGAFDGAKKLTTGAVEHAKGGTLVIEEIDRLPEHLQVQLAGMLSKMAFRRQGSKRDISTDLRVITTTTQNLWQLCKEEHFRLELYHRLSIVQLELPVFLTLSQKERRDWISYFMESTYTKMEKHYIKKIDKKAWDFLLSYPYIGNLQEVRNRVEELYIFCEDTITLEDIPKQMKNEKLGSPLLLKEVIKRHVQEVLDSCGGVKIQAAKALGIHRGTLENYLK